MTAYMSIGYHIHLSYVACKTNNHKNIQQKYSRLMWRRLFNGKSESCNGNKIKTARILYINPTTLYRKMK